MSIFGSTSMAMRFALRLILPEAFSGSFSVQCRAVWNSILVALLAVYCFEVSSLLLRYWLYEVE